MRKIYSNFLILSLAFIIGFVSLGLPISVKIYAEEIESDSLEAASQQYSISENDPSSLMQKDEYLSLPTLQEETYTTAALSTLGREVIEELLKWFTKTAIQGIVKSFNRFHVENIYEKALINRGNTDYRYYAVTYDINSNYNLQTDTVYTIDGAVEYLKKNKSNNIWTPHSDDAILLAKKLVPAVFGAPEGPENHWNSKRDDEGRAVSSQIKYYNHYHDAQRKYGHLFYGNLSYYGHGGKGNVPYILTPEESELNSGESFVE